MDGLPGSISAEEMILGRGDFPVKVDQKSFLLKGKKGKVFISVINKNL